MKLYTTKIKALANNELKTFSGPYVPGISFQDAQNYCERNGLGYCEVDGELIAEVDYNSGKITDYDNLN